MTTNDFPPQLVLQQTDPGLPGDPMYLRRGQTRHRGPAERRPAKPRGPGAGHGHACALALPRPAPAHRRRSLDRAGGALLCADPAWGVSANQRCWLPAQHGALLFGEQAISGRSGGPCCTASKQASRPISMSSGSHELGLSGAAPRGCARSFTIS